MITRAAGRRLRALEWRNQMRTNHIIAALILTIAAGLAANEARTQNAPPAGLKRLDLLKHDLSIPGQEVIQVLIDFAPGAAAPRHAHPGEELVYVLEGSLEYVLEGRSPITLNAGEVLLIPEGKSHAVKNASGSNARELATYVVEKGKPLLKFTE